MEPPGWIAPASGVVAIGIVVVLVGVYAVGLSVPEQHEATVAAVVAAPADDVWALLTDPMRRPSWRPKVARIGQIADIGGNAVYRELDPGGDRFDFVVLSDERPDWVIAAARPEDLGMSMTFAWNVAPLDIGETRVTLTGTGAVPNPFFRGMWWLRAGPYVGIEDDLSAIGLALTGSAVAVVREPGP